MQEVATEDEMTSEEGGDERRPREQIQEQLDYEEGSIELQEEHPVYQKN